MATDKLAAKLKRRDDRIVAAEEGKELEKPEMKAHISIYTEFPEFSRKQIKVYQDEFNLFDKKKDKFIDLPELKYMMEKLGAAQTHVALKQMIAEVDEDHDSMISFREFLLIFRKAAAGELEEFSGFMELYKQIQEIDVDEVGVHGAKDFFEAKISAQAHSNCFEEEIREEQEERKREEEEKRKRHAEFKAKQNMWH